MHTELPSDLPFSPAAQRNQGPILDVLRRVLPAQARVLEVACGTGQHAAHFAAQQPGWRWQPSDGDARSLPGLAARCRDLPNVRPPVLLDVLVQRPDAWPGAPGGFDAVYCANMLHISPWATCAALMRGAATCLAAGGVLVLYGPFFVDGEPPAPGNLAFDVDLRERDGAWGVRRLAAVTQEAHAVGLAFEERVDMPANNLMLVFRLLA
jgi:SAM-dependent methyltransferase